MENLSFLLWGLVFGSVGFGYFIYGKKQKHKVALISGIALMILPYIIENQAMLILTGLILLACPRFIKL
jgi:hypothetical protein